MKPDWEALIAEQEKSGLTQQAFCQQRGIVLTSFVYYRCRIKKIDKNPQSSNSLFNSVKLAKKEEIPSGEIRLLLPNGFQCSFPVQLEASQIK